MSVAILKSHNRKRLLTASHASVVANKACLYVALTQHFFSRSGRATLKASTEMLETELKRVCASLGHTYLNRNAFESVLSRHFLPTPKVSEIASALGRAQENEQVTCTLLSSRESGSIQFISDASSTS